MVGVVCFKVADCQNESKGHFCLCLIRTVALTPCKCCSCALRCHNKSRRQFSFPVRPECRRSGNDHDDVLWRVSTIQRKTSATHKTYLSPAFQTVAVFQNNISGVLQTWNANVKKKSMPTSMHLIIMPNEWLTSGGSPKLPLLGLSNSHSRQSATQLQ